MTDFERPRYYNTQEAAEYFRVSVKTIQNFTSHGILGGFKAGRDWRFTLEDLQEGESRLRQRTKASTDPEMKAVKPSKKAGNRELANV